MNESSLEEAKTTLVLLEDQIINERRKVDYDVKEYTIEILVLKYEKGLAEDENEIFVPDYQRAFVWDQERQSKFIESIFLGLPIPYIFCAEVKDLGRYEIVDGSQRIRTLHRFINDELELKNLDILTKLNGLKFSDFQQVMQRKFKNESLRMIVLSDQSDEDVRFMLFERLNSGGDPLNFIEARLGASQGAFTSYIKSLKERYLFVKLTSFTDKARLRKEPEELIIRFFAYSESYKEFKGNVNDFLDEYLKNKNENGFDEEEYNSKFENMLNAVDKLYPNGFLKFPGSQKTPRLRFESISVGTYLALEEKKDLGECDMSWLESEEFEKELKGISSNNRLANRIEFVKNKLIGK